MYIHIYTHTYTHTHTLYRYIFPPSWPPYSSFSTLGELLCSYSCQPLISNSVGSISSFREWRVTVCKMLQCSLARSSHSVSARCCCHSCLHQRECVELLRSLPPVCITPYSPWTCQAVFHLCLYPHGPLCLKPFSLLSVCLFPPLLSYASKMSLPPGNRPKLQSELRFPFIL